MKKEYCERNSMETKQTAFAGPFAHLLVLNFKAEFIPYHEIINGTT